MKTIIRILWLTCLLFSGTLVHAQCGAGFTRAEINWDNLDYYYNSGSNIAPYGFSGGNFVSNTMEQTQKFAFGITDLTIATSAAGIVKGENLTHTGDLASYTGADAQFTPSANGQTITLTFGTNVENVSFTLYDIDNLASLALTATDASNAAQNINVTAQATTILTIVGSGGVAPTVTASASAQANNSNQGSATVLIVGPVKKIVITIATIGADPIFWLSDIIGCVPGTFPTNYQQLAANSKPYTGQPDYFIVTPDNNSAYMVDPATGKAWFLFTDPARTFMNSYGYDAAHHILYYTVENASLDKTNKTIKKYDFTTGTMSTVVADITAAPLNIPTFTGGIEGAGAAFYNGSLYLGVEGGQFDASNSRKNIIWRIDFDASLNPISASQVKAADNYSGATDVYDWADFVIKDGVIYDFNGAYVNGSPRTFPNSSYIHYNMMNDSILATYINPASANFWAGQAGLTWNGDLYSFWWNSNGGGSGGVRKYDPTAGGAVTAIGTNFSITKVGPGPAWPNGSGDASENFKPAMDYGDAPATYDPAAGDPAVHEVDTALHLGASIDREWVERGQTALANSDNFDDAISVVPVFANSSHSYLAQIKVYNNTGAAATVVAWLDLNGDGIFTASEGITVAVPLSKPSLQTFNLSWSSVVSSLANGSYTYLRIRLAYGTSGLTTSTPTGYFNNGEVEDYRVPVTAFPLAAQLNRFDAHFTSDKYVSLKWSVLDESDFDYYAIERSSNRTDWQLVGTVEPKGSSTYELTDNSPFAGTSYYRLRIVKKDGNLQMSDIKMIQDKIDNSIMSISPNPASNRAVITLNSGLSSQQGSVEIINAQGAIVHNEKLTIHSGINTIELPEVAGLPSGRYMVRVVTALNSYAQNLIINK